MTTTNKPVINPAEAIVKFIVVHELCHLHRELLKSDKFACLGKYTREAAASYLKDIIDAQERN